MTFKDQIYNQTVKKYEGKIYLNCCVGVEYDLDLLEYSVNYYKKLGVDEFFYILNTADSDSPNLKEAIKILDKYDNIHTKIWIEEFYDGTRKNKEEDIIKGYVKEDDWLITIDIDEFYEFPMGLRELIYTCERKGYICVLGKLIDRLSSDGSIKKIDKTKSLNEQLPVRFNDAPAGFKGCRMKTMLRKAFVSLTGGHHVPRPDIELKHYYPFRLKVQHFHWSKGVIEKLQDRVEIWKSRKNNSWRIHQEVIDYYKIHKTLF